MFIYYRNRQNFKKVKKIYKKTIKLNIIKQQRKTKHQKFYCISSFYTSWHRLNQVQTIWSSRRSHFYRRTRNNSAKIAGEEIRALTCLLFKFQICSIEFKLWVILISKHQRQQFWRCVVPKKLGELLQCIYVRS